MNRNAERDVRVLQRIVALLLVLADVADGVGGRSWSDRVYVLSVLRHAEAVVWGFAIRTACGVPTMRCALRSPTGFALPDDALPDPDDAAEAVRLAGSFRALALILAGWAARHLAYATLLAAARRGFRETLLQHGPSASRSFPAALPAPDSS